MGLFDYIRFPRSIEDTLSSYTLSSIYNTSEIFNEYYDHVGLVNNFNYEDCNIESLDLVQQIKEICKELELDEDYFKFAHNTYPYPDFPYAYSFFVQKPGALEQLAIFKGFNDDLLIAKATVPETSALYSTRYTSPDPSFAKTDYKNLDEAIVLWLNEDEIL